jgi:hypothetical protein
MTIEEWEQCALIVVIEPLAAVDAKLTLRADNAKSCLRQDLTLFPISSPGARAEVAECHSKSSLFPFVFRREAQAGLYLFTDAVEGCSTPTSARPKNFR